MNDLELSKAYSWIEENLLPDGSKLKGIQKIVLCKYFRYSGDRPNFLTVMPTGAGKSVLFQGPALYKSITQNDGQKKLNIVISPLKALMDDQVLKISKFNDEGVKRVACIHTGTLDDDAHKTIDAIKSHNLVLLYVAPERIIMKSFFNLLKQQAEAGFISSITFDEAHCVISWGNSFRPKYVTALRKCITLQSIGGNFPIHLLSATVPAKARLQLLDEIEIEQTNITPSLYICDKCNAGCNLCHSEIEEEKKDDYLGIQKKALENTLYPINKKIELSCREIRGLSDNGESEQFQKLREVYNILTEDGIYQNLIGPKPASRAIIFTNTRDDAAKGSKWLEEEFIANNSLLKGKVDYFHAKREDVDKEVIKKEYYNGDKTVLFATTAFGLGMDIPNIHLVINFAPPLFLEDYLQEVGRAGRNPEYDIDGQTVKAICLYSKHDFDYAEKLEVNSTGDFNELDKSDEVTPNKIAIAFSRILKYYYSIVGNSMGRPMIPIPSAVILAGEEGKSLYEKKTSEVIESQFLQCLNWLSEKNGLNRIELGFPCRNVFEVGFNEGENTSKCSEKVKFLYSYAQKLLETNQGFGKHLFIEASRVYTDKASGIEDINDFNKVIDSCYRKHLFGKEYQMLFIELRNEDTYKNYIENDSLPELDNITQYLSKNCASEDMCDSLFDSIKKTALRVNHDVSHIWLFFYYLSEIFTPEEINALCHSLYAYIVNQIKNDDNNWFKWGDLVSLLRKKDSWGTLFRHEVDDDDARLILLALSSLGYLSVNNKCHDYYEIRMIDDKPIDWDTETETLVKNRIIEIIKGKQESSTRMKDLVFENVLNEENIIAYSQGQTSKLNN